MISKAKRTKQFIVEKTAPIFNAKGYVGTSLNDMMDATGLTKGSIYGNFENKDDVALAAFDYNFQQVVLYIKSKMDERISQIDKLLVYPEVYRNFLQIPFLKAGCPIINTSTEADDTHPLLREKAINALHFWKSSIERQVKQGVENGEIKSDVKIEEFISLFVSLIQGSILQLKLTGETISLNITMDFIVKMINDLKA